MPDQKMGIDTPTSATTMLTLSASLFFGAPPPSTPRATPRSDATMMAQTASSAVAGKRAAISCRDRLVACSRTCRGRLARHLR